EAEGWARLDAALADVVRRLEGLVSEVRDIAETLRDLGRRWEADPERLEEIERRLQLLRRLEAKYRRPLDDLIIYRVGLDEQETGRKKEEEDFEGVEQELRAAFDKRRGAADARSKQRRKVAKKLAAETQRHLVDLGMPDARLDALLEPVPLGDDPTTAEVPAW